MAVVPLVSKCAPKIVPVFLSAQLIGRLSLIVRGAVAAAFFH
jgi:hypothetical protein